MQPAPPVGAEPAGRLPSDGDFWDRAGEERTRLILDNAYDAFVAMSADGLITEWNRQAEIVFGWARAEAIGRVLADTIIPPEFREAHGHGLARFLASGEGPLVNRVVEVAALRRDGRQFPAELAIAPIRVGGQYLFAAFVRDVTERKRAEEELRRAKEAAEAASRAKSEFLANMSHEIRTPMNGIIGMTELALDTELTREQRDYLSTVKASAESLLTIINDILDFSRVEANKLHLAAVDFALRDGLGDTLKALAVRAKQNGLELVCHVPPDVPDALHGDPLRLRQVLINLVGNAIKFTEKGEVVVSVEKSEGRSQKTEGKTDGGALLSSDSCLLKFSVKDTGVGIPPEKQRLIFEAFTQADTSTTREYGGTGLGLTISQRLVELMGGRMWVESEVGRGSTFHFTARFGLARGEPTAPREVAPAAADRRRLRVLVAEDNLINQRLAVRLLEKAGHAVTVVETGLEAVAAVGREPFDLVLMDVQMPEMGGFEATAAIRAREKANGGHIPIVAMTAHAMKGDRERCLEAGMDDYVSKPVRADDLFDALTRVAGEKGLPSPPTVNETELMVRVGGDRTLMRELVGLFLKTYPTSLAELRAAASRGDPEAVHRLAHGFGGMAGHFGAREVIEAARRLEVMGRAGNLGGAEGELAALAGAVERLRPDLDRLLGEEGTS
jgi:PAS domain S-box-containing protein